MAVSFGLELPLSCWCKSLRVPPVFVSQLWEQHRPFDIEFHLSHLWKCMRFVCILLFLDLACSVVNVVEGEAAAYNTR